MHYEDIEVNGITYEIHEHRTDEMFTYDIHNPNTGESASLKIHMQPEVVQSLRQMHGIDAIAEIRSVITSEAKLELESGVIEWKK